MLLQYSRNFASRLLTKISGTKDYEHWGMGCGWESFDTAGVIGSGNDELCSRLGPETPNQQCKGSWESAAWHRDSPAALVMVELVMWCRI